MKKCFVIMPFSQTTPEHTAEYWEGFFRDFVKPSLAAHQYQAYKSVDTPNNITKNIVRELAMADLVLAVLTDGKPNVYYELGVRHSLRHGTIMVLEGDQRPFDISNYGILSYARDNLTRFTEDLGRYIRVAEDRSEDSPVADFLNQRITVSVNLAIGRLRQCVGVVRQRPASEFESALQDIRTLQSCWHVEREQVSIVQNDLVCLHPDLGTQAKRAEECWVDETMGSVSLYSIMKERRWGFRIAQIKDKRNRLTAVAFDTIDVPECLIVAEAHYHQESRPF